MAKCKNCRNYDHKAKWCDLVEDSPHEDMERDCDCYKKMTNADRIRSMSDEELADLLDEVFNNIAEFDFPCSSCAEKINCDVCFLEWLQQEAEE